MQTRHLTALAWGLMLVSTSPAEEFPAELVQFEPYRHNPVFTAAGGGAWDARIRERGWIRREGNLWQMWFTGYDGTREGRKKLGYAVSTDGLHWTRHPDNPLYGQHWVEDMMVVKQGETYYMFAEGAGDLAHLLTSRDGLHWTRVGPLDIRLKSGQPIEKGPRGTPTVWVEEGTWHLFYERRDQGVWLATSQDRKVWTNVQDTPVLARGPESYDKFAVALNQVIRYRGRYYAYYHASDTPDWKEWSTNVATSTDLVHWKKYPHNPIAKQNKSSGIVIHDGERFRLYTMHNQVHAHFATSASGGE